MESLIFLLHIFQKRNEKKEKKKKVEEEKKLKTNVLT